MATLLIPNSLFSLPLSLPTTPSRAYFRPSRLPVYPGLGFRFSPKTRGLTVVTRAGPSTSSYVFAFLLPLSLLAGTVFTSLRIADRLDQKFLEELILNEAMREAEEEDDDNDDEGDDEGKDFDGSDSKKDEVKIFAEKIQEPVLPHTRNRPKREV
ncbi:uncharacterized protein LOC123212974 [Mangifera indica]|uniref:uncharacterized protein LOC123212974 n=1 Tax=Mangifera indica TaxID=29780 RepID=UPI001CFA3028|nr:uncharacterized protein LOC123212974 [Mangifera indica]